MHKTKICVVSTSLITVKSFLLPHLFELSKIYDVTLVANIDDENFKNQINFPLNLVHIQIERKISLFHDIKALFKLILLFYNQKFDMVKSVAPKAGLLAMLAAQVTFVPIRLHIFQGEVWAARTGFMRLLLKNLDRLLSKCATHILVVSESERKFLIQNKIFSSSKSKVLLNGSICGVNTNKFKYNEDQRNSIRGKLKLNSSDVLLIYVGRLNKDKGIYELLIAFKQLSSNRQNIHLLIVGPDEENIIVKNSELINQLSRIHIEPVTLSPENYMSASEILILPSHREGFGLVIIEAAAVGITAIGSDIYGISDAINNNETGLLFENKNISDLVNKINILVVNSELRNNLAKAAKLRCLYNFEESKVIAEYVKYYAKILAAN